MAGFFYNAYYANSKATSVQPTCRATRSYHLALRPTIAWSILAPVSSSRPFW